MRPRKRTPVFARPEAPAAFQMTRRDRQLITWVHELRFLTANQLHRLVFGGKPSSRTWCEQRLKLLFQHGYLGRVPKPHPSGLGAPLAVYCLEAKGRDLVAELKGVARREVYWERWDNRRGHFFLEHTLALNELRINLLLGAEIAGHTFSRWIDERTLRSSAMKDFIEDPMGAGKIPIVPDGWGAIRLANGKLLAFFVELDRGTQDINEYKRKVRGYLAYWERGEYLRRYETTSLTVLTVVATGEPKHDRRRVAQLVGWTEGERRWARRADSFEELFWFTDLTSTSPTAILSEPVWWVAGDRDLHTLLTQ